MEHDHDEVSWDEREQAAHRGKVPDARQPESAQPVDKPGQLHRLVKGEPRDEAADDQQQRARVGQLLERIVGFGERRLFTAAFVH